MTPRHHEYCIVGAGPAGVQLAYFLHTSPEPRDYIVFERAANAEGADSQLGMFRKQAALIAKKLEQKQFPNWKCLQMMFLQHTVQQVRLLTAINFITSCPEA